MYAGTSDMVVQIPTRIPAPAIHPFYTYFGVF